MTTENCSYIVSFLKYLSPIFLRKESMHAEMPGNNIHNAKEEEYTTPRIGSRNIKIGGGAGCLIVTANNYFDILAHVGLYTPLL